MNDIYSAPSSTLTEPTQVGEYGSLERGIAGDYSLSVGDVLSEAWAKTKGAKWTINVAAGLFSLSYIVAAIAGLMVAPSPADGGEVSLSQTVLSSVVQQLVLLVTVVPLGAGLLLIALRRAVDAPIRAGIVFSGYSKLGTIIATSLLMYVLIGVGFLLLVIPGIYLAVAYYFAVPLVIEKNLNPWQALEASRKAISKRWFTMLGLGIVLAVINIIPFFTLGIAWIWTVPMSVIAYGIVYRNMFGCEAATVAQP